MKRFKINVQPTTLSVFALLTSIAVIITLGLQYYTSKQLAFNATNTFVNHVSENSIKELNKIDDSAFKLVSVLELLSGNINISELQNEEMILKNYTVLIKNNPLVYALYVADTQGQFYEIINLNIDASLKRRYVTSPQEEWLVIKITKDTDGSFKEEQKFYNKSLKLVRTAKAVSGYDPRARVWFKMAKQTEKSIKTPPYKFANFDSLGFTYAKQILQTQNVIGVDISLRSLSRFIEEQRAFEDEMIYLSDLGSKMILASHSSNEANFHEVQKLMEVIDRSKDGIIKIENKIYFATNKKLFSDSSMYLTILVPEEKIMKPYNEKIMLAVWTNIILMFFMLPLIWYFSRIIVDPIHELQLQNEKVKDRKYDQVSKIDTSIKELSELSKSMVSMSQSIKEYENNQKRLLDSFIKIIADAIDAKSRYTGGHCNRVPILTLELAKAASEDKGVFNDFVIENEDELREISIAAWLHDCGKITMPEHVVDKATKLETICNRIHEIRTRFEVIYRDRLIEFYKMLLDGKDEKSARVWLEKEHTKLHDDFAFIANVNIGGEFMDEGQKERIKEIAKITWERVFDNTLGLSNDEKARKQSYDESKIENLLADKPEHIIRRPSYQKDDYQKYNIKMDIPEHLYNLGEIHNLSVERGTLTPEDRFKINEHIIMTIRMLEQLPFPDQLKRVPEYAGAHHETLVGTGYPRKLTQDQISIPARIMALADVFEALTAIDRPYKDGKKLSEALKIMTFMVKDSHLDGDLFKLFLRKGLYLEYAKKYLSPNQIDNVDVEQLIAQL